MRLRLVERDQLDPWPHRRINPSDKAALGMLMLAAYRRTVDDEGETLPDATAEVDRVLGGHYGSFLSDCSFLVEEAERIVGASMVTLWEKRPLLAFVFVHPDLQRRGLGTFLIGATGNALLAAGYSDLDLLVTEENEPAVALYRKLGFEVVRRLDGPLDRA
jgi:ribosomal protein S18 acetylase RimI-like enzyme